MDSQKQFSELIPTHISPAQLWVGQHESLLMHLYSYLQKLFCNHDACGTCAQCRAITEQQHHGITWLYPDKQYTLEQIAIIQETIAFSLNENQHHFFIIQKAETLSQTCSNSLLKSVEEPPAGYHFIFMTDRASYILPTIKSRCVIHTFKGTLHPIEEEPLFVLFSRESAMAPSTFLKLIDKQTPTERASIEILDQLLQFWLKQYKQAIIDNKKQQAHTAEKIINALRTAAQQPPMSGSSKLFWKNLFLQIKE